MESKATRLFLVRHAETEWNTSRIFQGHLDSPITPRGLRQAQELAERLAPEGIRAVYSSDQARSMRTAQVVAQRLKLQVIPSSELREIDCGEWTRKSYDEVRTAWPEHFDNWRNHPERHRMPEGESVEQVQRRALNLLEEVHGRHPGQAVCVVTHNTVVRAVMCHLRGWSLSRLWEGPRQPNCVLNLIELVDGKASLLVESDVSHLTSVGTAGTTSIT